MPSDDAVRFNDKKGGYQSGSKPVAQLPKIPPRDRVAKTGTDMSGETENSDFVGIVFNAAVAAMDGCPGVERIE